MENQERRRNDDETIINDSVESVAENPEKKPLEIATAKTLGDLYQALREKGTISGSQEDYDAETLIDGIEEMRASLQRIFDKKATTKESKVFLATKILTHPKLKQFTRNQGLRESIFHSFMDEFSE